ncbi:MAG: hypothetical protein ACHQ52_10170 [Candidatus Eisenbacteria bacterium]
MRKGGSVAAFVLSAVVVAWAQTAAAQTDTKTDPGFEFSGYRIPSQNWRSWFVNGAGSGYSQDHTDVFSNSRIRSSQGALTTGFESGHDSDPLYYDWRADLGVHGSVAYGRSTTDTLGQRSGQQDMVEMWRLAGSLRSYPWQPPVGLTASAQVSGNYGQDWQYFETLTNGVPTFDSDMSTRSYDYAVAGSGGAGLGRVRDAGNVYRAWLFERRLVRDGTLTRPLSSEARARLADLFSVEAGYGYAHQFPDKAFWSEVEKLLHEDGALPDSGMAAYGLMHALDAMVGGATYDVRRIGWFAGPFVQGTHQHTVNDLSQNGASYHMDSWNDQVLAGFSAEYHHPVGIGWQLDLSASASADVKGVDRTQLAAAAASAQYRFAERWLAWVRATDQRYLTQEGTPNDVWYVSVDTGAQYQLEDHWRLSLGLNQTQFHRRQPTEFYDRRLTGSLGIAWSWGRFDAPGLIAPVRPLAVGPP